MRWGGFFDVDGMRREIDRLNDRSTSPGFWDDPENARKVTQERAAIEARVEGMDKAKREAQDLLELLDMAEGDESVIDEVTGQIPPLEKRVRQMEVARMLAGKEDRSDAIISIHPGTGGVRLRTDDARVALPLRVPSRQGPGTGGSSAGPAV